MEHKAVAEFYNSIKSRFGDDYEAKRWFRSPITRSHFDMATKAISEVLTHLTFTNCFELGPGAGTWTKLLIAHVPHASYTLLDISETMLGMAKRALSELDVKINFVTSDFLTYDETTTHDFFFSSRALEYVVDKEKAVQKIYNLLSEGGEGLIITKNPRYFGDAIFGRDIPELHRNQISPGALIGLLRDAGFHICLVRPVTVTVPLFKSSKLNSFAFKFLRHSWVPWIHRIFAESYLVYFKKHGG